ncbi:class I SAM-dependent methyltransferase [Singulisphaera rosea]
MPETPNAGRLARALAALRDETSLTDRAILGEHLQGCDEDADYLQGRDYYLWYYLLARHYRPRTIAEIGTRFGYSLKSLILGSLSQRPPDELKIYSFDNESYEPGSTRVARALCDGLGVASEFNAMDTQESDDLGISQVDLFHVDGCHTFAGAFTDLVRAKACLSPAGVILIDDIDNEAPHLPRAVGWFCREFRFTYDYVPHFRGLGVLTPAR